MDPLTERLLGWAVSGVLGAVAALVAVRTRLALMDREIADNKAATNRLVASIERLEKRIERRQLVTLEMLANIQTKLGIDGRTVTDLMSRFLAETTADD